MSKQMKNIKVDTKTLTNLVKQKSVNRNNIKKKDKKKRKKQTTNNMKKETVANTTKIRPNQENVQKIKSKKKKNKLKRLHNSSNTNTETKVNFSVALNTLNFKEVKKDLISKSPKFAITKESSENKSSSSLLQRMHNQLKSSHFRFLNEQLYTTEGKEAKLFFEANPESFKAYHEGFRQQVAKWPMNPLDKIITAIKKMSKDHIVADFGCGEAKLARSVPQKVFSFDLIETVPGVIACDMAHCKLPASSIDVAVYCLSFMGINLHEYLAEANRVLKIGGILKIAEVESRFDKIENFIQGLQCFGFKLIWKDLSHNLFYFLDFKKERNIKNKNKLPTMSLHPCMYKKR